MSTFAFLYRCQKLCKNCIGSKASHPRGTSAGKKALFSCWHSSQHWKLVLADPTYAQNLHLGSVPTIQSIVILLAMKTWQFLGPVIKFLPRAIFCFEKQVFCHLVSNHGQGDVATILISYNNQTYIEWPIESIWLKPNKLWCTVQLST